MLPVAVLATTADSHGTSGSLPPPETGYTMSPLPSSRSAPVDRQNCRQENPELNFPFFRAAVLIEGDGLMDAHLTKAFIAALHIQKRWALTMALGIVVYCDLY